MKNKRGNNLCFLNTLDKHLRKLARLEIAAWTGENRERSRKVTEKLYTTQSK